MKDLEARLLEDALSDRPLRVVRNPGISLLDDCDPLARVRLLPHAELPEWWPGVPTEEWRTFRREVGRLLAEGHAGRWALRKGDEVVGLFDEATEAKRAGFARFGFSGYHVQQVAEAISNRPLVLWYLDQCRTPAGRSLSTAPLCRSP